MVTTCHTHGSCLGRLTVIRARLALLLILVSQMDVETTSLSPCKGTISGTVGSFQSGGVFATGRALTIVNSPVCVCKVKVMNPQRVPSHYCLATYDITD